MVSSAPHIIQNIVISNSRRKCAGDTFLRHGTANSNSSNGAGWAPVPRFLAVPSTTKYVGLGAPISRAAYQLLRKCKRNLVPRLFPCARLGKTLVNAGHVSPRIWEIELFITRVEGYVEYLLHGNMNTLQSR